MAAPLPFGELPSPAQTATPLALSSVWPGVQVDPLIGQKVSDYEVLDVIGTGGMGVVYGGIQPVIKKRVAIKVLRPEFAAEPTLVKRLEEEAKAVNAIAHRNIIDIFGLGVLPDGRRYIIMEYLEGQPLDLWLAQKGPLESLAAVELLIDICTPLMAAHAAGVIHRDLKPSNVFLVRQSDGARHIKLLDFGLAKRLASGTGQTSMTTISGTPNYMAPEQCRGLEATARTDIYALGVMAFEIITGRLPFDAEVPMDVMMQHVNKPPEPPSKYAPATPPELDRVVLAMLEKAPEARPPSADAVRALLKGLELQLRTAGLKPTRVVTGEFRVAQPPPAASPAVAALSVSSLDPPVAEAAEPPRRRAGPLVAGIGALVAVALAAVLLVTGAWNPWAGAPAVPTPTAVTPIGIEPAVVKPAAPTTPSVEPTPGVEPTPPAGTEPEPEPAGAEPTAAPVSPPAHPTVLRRPPDRSPGSRPGRRAPSEEDLKKRIASLEGRLRAATPSGAKPDALALKALNSARVTASMPTTPDSRLKLSATLDAWERTFLPR